MATLAKGALPANVEELTPAWFTTVLEKRFPGLQVHEARLVQRINGASSKLRMALSGNRDDLPATVIVKAGFEPHSAALAAMHRNETHAYRDLLSTVKVNVPRCFYAGEDAEGKALVILEDLALRNARFLDLQQPIGFDLAARFLDGLACLHARWWEAPTLATRFGWADTSDTMQQSHYFDLLLDPSQFEKYATAPRGAALPKSLLAPERIAKAHAVLTRLHGTMPLTVVHGDAHLGNLYVDADGKPAFLDWQPRRAPWVLDVAYFIIAALDLVDRRRWETALLQYYLSRLTAYGVEPPSFDEAFDAYRREVIWGFLIWLLNGSHFQTESNNTAAATRFGMAMIDHDTFGRLQA